MNLDEVDERSRFKSYLNYTNSIGICIGKKLEFIEDFVNEIISEKQYKKIDRNKNADLKKIANILRNAWFTELQLNNLCNPKEFSKLTLQWGLIYAYYSCYLGLRGFILASNQQVYHNHRKTLDCISSEIQSRPKLFPHPWKILCKGDPDDKNSLEFKHLSNTPSFVNQLSNSSLYNYNDTFAKFLKTTRRKQIKRLNEQWKSDNNYKKIPPKYRKQNIQNTNPTSLFDCLYRMRIRANYENADTFMIENIENEEAYSFHEALQTITFGSLLILELVSAKYISKSNYKKMVEGFDDKITNTLNIRRTPPKDRFSEFNKKL